METKGLIKITRNGVSAYELFKYLEINTQFKMWISRRIQYYNFIEGQDYSPYLVISDGGRTIEDYVLSMDMAKELAMVEKTAKGKQIRKYFIDIENKYKQQLLRDSTKETRRELTDIIQDSGENERMHGHGFSTYTKLIYKKLGIEYTKQDNFRDSLAPEQLKAVKTLEHLAEGYLRLGYDYSQIKNVLPECITKKQEELDAIE